MLVWGEDDIWVDILFNMGGFPYYGILFIAIFYSCYMFRLMGDL